MTLDLQWEFWAEKEQRDVKDTPFVKERSIDAVSVVESWNKAEVGKATVIVEETSKIKEKAIILYRDNKNDAWTNGWN